MNLDREPLPGVDVVADLDACRTSPLPFNTDSVSNFHLSHVLEHLRDPLGLMGELHRIAIPNATCTIRLPYGTSDDAWEDPTHLRPYFVGSFGYFGQPYYWRADYGYRGDWAVEMIQLKLPPHCLTTPELLGYEHPLRYRVDKERNLVIEMVAILRAVKPIRPPDRNLITLPPVWGVPK